MLKEFLSNIHPIHGSGIHIRFWKDHTTGTGEVNISSIRYSILSSEIRFHFVLSSRIRTWWFGTPILIRMIILVGDRWIILDGVLFSSGKNWYGVDYDSFSYMRLGRWWEKGKRSIHLFIIPVQICSATGISRMFTYLYLKGTHRDCFRNI